MRFRRQFLLLLFPALLPAASIDVASATECHLGPVVASDATECSLAAVRASARFAWAQPDPGGPVAAGVLASAELDPLFGSAPLRSALATIDFTLFLLSGGVPRQGLAQLDIDGVLDITGGPAEGWAQAGPYRQDFVADANVPGTHGLFDFPLGVPFAITLHARAFTSSTTADAAFAGSSGLVSISLYEASGAPVALEAVPEPGSAMLLACALALLAGCLRRPPGRQRPL